MNEQDWDEYKKIYADYEEAREGWHAAQMNLRGAFSELARHYDPASLDRNRLYEEELAHQRFMRARDRMRAFLKEKLKD